MNGGPPRKRSRSSSSASVSSPSAFLRYYSSSNHARYRSSASRQSSPHNPTNNHPLRHNEEDDSSNQRLLRLNVGGYPYDVVRTSLPLLETMMTDRWLSSCLVDSDGRIFLDRDGDAFGDILRYFRGGADFLLELVNTNSGNGYAGESNQNYQNHHNRTEVRQTIRSSTGLDRLRRLRVEADYYGLHQLVHDIDVVTVGQRVVFSSDSWARVAGCCLPRNQRNPNIAHHENDIDVGGFPNDQARENNGVNEVNGNRNAAENAGAMNGNNNPVPHNQNHNQEVERNENFEVLQPDEDDPEEEVDNVENEDEDVNEEGEEFEDAEDENIDDDEADVDVDEDANDEEIVEDADELAGDDENDEEVEEQFAFEDEDANQADPDQPPLYKNWSWSRQYGNPQILRPHPSHSSSMVVGQEGTYLLLLRIAAALPSPLARIKWDQEEEEDRRLTRGALRRRDSRRNRSERSTDMNGADDTDREQEAFGGREVEEDYFVTVNIEAPLNTVMDAIDESQTHFPLLRAGLWDYRTEEEVLNEDPVFATVCAMDVVSLQAGDILSVNFMNDEISRESSPFPDDAPPELMNSLTLVKIHGNTLARYERLKSAPQTLDNIWRKRFQDFSRKMGKEAKEENEEDSDDCDADACTNHDFEAEEFDRSLTRTAHWKKPRNDFLPTPFQPLLHSHASIVEFPHPGHYLLLGRVAVGCRRDATFLPVLSGGPLEGHRAQLSVRSAGGRLLHAVGAFAFEDKPRLGCSDLSILSDNGMFNDVVHVAQPGTELSITTTGDCRLHPEGTEVGPFCSAVSQSLSLMLLDDDVMEVDRYMIGTVRAADQHREIKWYHTRSSVSRSGGIGGTASQPSLFDIDGYRLVWRGCINQFPTNQNQHNGTNTAASSITTVLIIGSIPPLHRGYTLAILKNNEPFAISITPESLDMKGRHCHYFQEIVELSNGDEISIAECAYGGEGGQGWRSQLHVEPRRVEFDTRLGHLSFVVLENSNVY